MPDHPFYHTKEWKKLRNKIRTGQCSRCGDRPKRTVIDHIVELKDGGAPLEGTNLQELCYRCHTRKTNHQKELRATIEELGGGREEKRTLGDDTARGSLDVYPGNLTRARVSKLSPEMRAVLRSKLGKK